MSSRETNYKFHYLDLRARGEPIRWILRAANVDFEEEILPFSKWSSRKADFEFGTVPVLSVNGVQLHQTTVIGRFLGQSHHLAPVELWENARIEAVAETVHDVTQYGPLFFFARSRKKSEEEVRGHFEKFKSEAIGSALKVERTIGKEGWIRSETMTWVDIFVAAYMDMFENLFGDELYSKTPKLQSLVDTIRKLPPIGKWLETRPPINPWEKKLE